ELSSRTRCPTAIRLGVRVEDFVQFAVVLVHDQDMTVPRTGAPSLDRRIWRNGVWAWIAFRAVLKSDRHQGLCAWNRYEGNSDRASVVQTRSEIRMQADVGANGIDISVGVTVDR